MDISEDDFSFKELISPFCCLVLDGAIDDRVFYREVRMVMLRDGNSQPPDIREVGLLTFVMGSREDYFRLTIN